MRFWIASCASLFVDEIVTTTDLSLISAFVVESATVLGQLPAWCAIVVAAEPEPAAESALPALPALPVIAAALPAEPEPAIAFALPDEPLEPDVGSAFFSSLFLLHADAAASATTRQIAIRMVPPARMLRCFRMRFICAVVLAWSAVAAAEPDVRLPPGTRADGDRFVSARGLRDTTDFIAKQLDARGVAVDKIGPYRVRGVEVTRFVSATASTPWLAIHVVRVTGKTLISFVPRATP